MKNSLKGDGEGQEDRGTDRIMYNFDEMYQYTAHCIKGLLDSFPLPLLIFYLFSDGSVEMQIYALLT